MGGRPAPILVDLRFGGEPDKEARAIWATEVDFANALALVVSSAFSRIMANLFLRVSRPTYPTRLFNDYDAAVRWLAAYLEVSSG